VKCVEYVVARRGSYGSQDPTRKGGSDEGEEKPEKELVRSWIRRVVPGGEDDNGEAPRGRRAVMATKMRFGQPTWRSCSVVCCLLLARHRHIFCSVIFFLFLMLQVLIDSYIDTPCIFCSENLLRGQNIP
jgi:hypothetical protein